MTNLSKYIWPKVEFLWTYTYSHIQSDLGLYQQGTMGRKIFTAAESKFLRRLSLTNSESVDTAALQMMNYHSLQCDAVETKHSSATTCDIHYTSYQATFILIVYRLINVLFFHQIKNWTQELWKNVSSLPHFFVIFK